MLNFDQVDLADKGSECKPFFIKPDNILIAVDNPFYGLLKFSRKHGRIGNNQTVCRIEYLNNVIREIFRALFEKALRFSKQINF